VDEDISEGDDALEIRDLRSGLVVALIQAAQGLADDLEASLHREPQKLVAQ
jgi:hypothetical protein